MIKNITFFAGYIKDLACPSLLLLFIIAMTSSSKIARQHFLWKKILEHFRNFQDNFRGIHYSQRSKVKEDNIYLFAHLDLLHAQRVSQGYLYKVKRNLNYVL